jgi:DNA-binding HxlR family transcriptional regulator
LDEQQLKWIMENTKCCPIDNTFRVVGKKFTVLILRNIMNFNKKRFNQLLESIEGINPKTLSVRLREMEKNGLIERKVYAETPIRIEYNLTEKGKALKPVLEQMAAFSMQYCCEDVFKDGKPRTFHEVFGRSMKMPLAEDAAK